MLPTRRTSVASLLLALMCPSLGAQEHAHATSGEKIGTVHFETSCSPAVAQPFDRAVALLHSFEFNSAIAGFNAVLAVDSTCAMAHWGVALSRWTNPFASQRRTTVQLAPGRDAIRGAEHPPAKTARERAYIAAAGQLYADYEHVDQRTRIVNYEHAMELLAAQQPQDTEASIFYALSLAASALPGDKSYANQVKASAILENIATSQPNHPGLAHYLIHAHDVPQLADAGMGAAMRYANIAPSAPHALHMPSHIFTRVGAWQESINTNRRAIEAAKRDGSMGEALHASDYETYAYLQTGQDSAAMAVLHGLPALAKRFDPNAIGSGAGGASGIFALASIPARVALERRAWAEAAALEPAVTTAAWADAQSHIARALGASHTGDVAKARASIDSLTAIRDRLARTGENYWSDQVEIGRLVASAWLARAEHRDAEALATMRSAAAREDRTEKGSVTPGPLAPARELLGDLLMELGQPAAALTEYRATLEKEPKRFRALYGAMKAAALSGNREEAKRYASQLSEICILADANGRPELAEIRSWR